MNCAFQILSRKERRPDEAGAKLGNNNRMGVRQRDGGFKMGRFANQRRRSARLSQTSVVPDVRQSIPGNFAPAISEKEVAAKFSALVMDYSKNDLSDLSDRTSEAAKHWKDQTRAPNSSSLITMARRNKAIQRWVAAEIGIHLPDPNEEEAKTRAELQLAANMPGQIGVIARMLLSQKNGGN